MTTLLVILIAWVVLSIPVALLLARMFRSTRHDARTRGDADSELVRRPEFDRTPGGFASGITVEEGDTHRVFPPR
ncbi:hypothetical protein ABZ319_05375 [Nocardia sp. NPDC005978]|uniref:hypothetical protein n=1 Tax=Nocardia sp. NPDC005978 TaxID=3156725 RepID=UPI0033B924AB